MESLLDNGMGELVRWFIVLTVALAVAVAAVCGVRMLVQTILRHMVNREYSVSVPSSMKVQRNHTGLSTGRFRMGYPAWSSPKRDGTRDLRTNDTRIIHHPTVIIIDGWQLSVKDPFEAYDLVLALRSSGHALALCPEEQRKHEYLTELARRRAAATSVARIVDMFKDRPTDFEWFCVDLFRTLGWRARPTPPSRDGGYDLSMVRSDGVTYIAECKCWSPRHHVGRPIIQKLHGANVVVRARGMMVVTTSLFSQDAIAYAEQAGVELVDGDGLMELCRRAWGLIPPSFVPAGSVRLTRGEIMSRIPADMRGRY